MVVAIQCTTFTACKTRFHHHEPTAKRWESALATRAPHRPNPVGLSLVLLEHVTVVNKGKRKQTCLVLRGLDLVDGTPVNDVKPFVPWDQNGCSVPNSNVNMNNWSLCMTQLRVLSWVSADDELASVTWTESAKSDLFKARQHVHNHFMTMVVLRKHVEQLKKLLLKILMPCGMDEARPTMRHLSLPFVN
jgi:hypothetical protein